jgi:hypothetical protein
MTSADHKKRWRDIPFYPFLLSVYAVLALLGTNIAEVNLSIALRPLLAVILATAIGFLNLNAALRDPHRAGFWLSGSLLLFYTYGHVYHVLERTPILSLNLGRHRILGPTWFILFLILSWMVIAERISFHKMTAALNAASLVLIILPLLQIGQYEFHANTAPLRSGASASSSIELSLPPGKTAPDIYYIILDAYSRDDVLQEDFDLDNERFLSRLNDLGFFVARCSQSNYAQTQLSLASSLNMDYLSDLGEAFVPGNTSRAGVDELIHHSAVRRALEDLGYRTVAFETGFKYTQIEDADLYLAPRAGALEKLHMGGGLSDFDVMFISSTAGLMVSDGIITMPKILQPDFENPRRIHRERVLYVFDQLSKLPDLEGPKFVFAHLVIPHPPYVFGPQGEFTDYDRDEVAGYRDQVTYLNKVIIPLVEGIVSRSSKDPIIVIQADHGGIGTPPIKRTKILNAYHLPGMDENQLDSHQSPVNTFRLIFNHYFEGSFPLLQNLSYFSGYKRPYDYTLITDDRPGCRQN